MMTQIVLNTYTSTSLLHPSRQLKFIEIMHCTNYSPSALEAIHSIKWLTTQKSMLIKKTPQTNQYIALLYYNRLITLSGAITIDLILRTVEASMAGNHHGRLVITNETSRLNGLQVCEDADNTTFELIPLLTPDVFTCSFLADHRRDD